MIKTKKYKIDVTKLLMRLSMIWLIASLIVATIQLKTLGV